MLGGFARENSSASYFWRMKCPGQELSRVDVQISWFTHAHRQTDSHTDRQIWMVIY